MRRLLVIGGRGQLGKDLCRSAESGWTVEAPSHDRLDLTDDAAVGAALAHWRPDVVVNCAALHDLARCEADEALALRINATAVEALARSCRSVGARLITLSTDYVFSGEAGTPYDEEAPCGPLQAYGRSKRVGELAALAVWPDGVLAVRTCGLYGLGGSRGKGSNFVEKRLRDAASHGRLEVGSDLICTPTATCHLAPALLALARESQAPGGVYHLTAEGACSWAEFTAAILELSGSSCRVEPVDRRGDYGPIRRPPYSVLANGKAAGRGIRLPHWRDGLAEYLRRRLSVAPAGDLN